MRKLLSRAALALFLLGAVLPSLRAAGLKTQNVVILVIDGPRYSETWGDPDKKHIPRIARKLAPRGVVCANFWNDGPTYTNAGHAAVTTGFYQEIDNSAAAPSPGRPGLFQLYLKARGLPADAAWIVASKDKLRILADSADPAWKGRHTASVDCGKAGGGYREDPETLAAAFRTLKDHHPRLLLVNLKGPDARGHANDWPGYLAAIRETDDMAWRLWTRLQSDPFYRDRTALFITNDHGRHLDGQADGFVGHGDACDGCRRIFFFAAGPDFKKGVVTDRKRGQIDLAATAARLLDLSLPGAPGAVMDELFAQDAAMNLSTGD